MRINSTTTWGIFDSIISYSTCILLFTIIYLILSYLYKAKLLSSWQVYFIYALILCICLWVHVYVHACVGSKRLTSNIFLTSSASFVSKGLPLNLNPQTQLSWSRDHSPHDVVMVVHCHTQILTSKVWIELRSVFLRNKHISFWAFPSLPHRQITCDVNYCFLNEKHMLCLLYTTE